VGRPAEEIAEPLGLVLDGEVTELRRLSGGASRETFSFALQRVDVASGAWLDPEPMILQRVRPGPVAGAFAMQSEAALLRAAEGAGVPVATVIEASDDSTVIGAPFIVVRRLDGETIARRILRDDAYAIARGRLVEQCAVALARVHTIAPSDVPDLVAQDQLGSLVGLYDMLEPTMGPHPAFELAFRQLERSRPPTRDDVVLHGDFRLGNLLVDADGLVAAIDWELAHLGDPLEDLAWFSIRAWAFGGPGEVAGIGSVDQLVDAYEHASGASVDRTALRWWRAVETLRWGVICMLQAHTHLSGASRSVELAAIGRRVCETEYDLMRLLR
jgi:aminoglycoside phosphotransferase (APT) family kinase protein